MPNGQSNSTSFAELQNKVFAQMFVNAVVSGMRAKRQYSAHIDAPFQGLVISMEGEDLFKLATHHTGNGEGVEPVRDEFLSNQLQEVVDKALEFTGYERQQHADDRQGIFDSVFMHDQQNKQAEFDAAVKTMAFTEVLAGAAADAIRETGRFESAVNGPAERLSIVQDPYGFFQVELRNQGNNVPRKQLYNAGTLPVAVGAAVHFTEYHGSPEYAQDVIISSIFANDLAGKRAEFDRLCGRVPTEPAPAKGALKVHRVGRDFAQLYRLSKRRL